MRKLLLNINSLRIVFVLSLFLSSFVNSYSQTYECYVGEVRNLPEPTPPKGSFIAITGEVSTTKPDNIQTYGSLKIYVHKYFSGTATVSVPYKYSYWSSEKNRMVPGDATAYYSIKCKPTTIKLKKTEIEVSVGDYADIEYETDPSNVELRVKYSSSNNNIASVEEDDNIISNKGGWSTVTGVSEGTCYVTVKGNTGNADPRCTIKVVDNMWLTTDVGSGDVSKGTKVTINCKKSGATIYYTTDGTEPNKSSRKYTEPIVLTESITLKAKAYLGDKESKTIERKYDVVAHSVGDVFTAKTAEGVELTFKVYKESSSLMLQVGDGVSPAINQSYSGKITIPKSVDGMTVDRVSSKAFYGSNITSLSVVLWPRYYEPNCFQNCKKLTTIEFEHASTFFIMSEAFKDCVSLEKIINKPYGGVINTSSGDMRFAKGNSNTTASFSNRVFENCNNIKSIYMEREESSRFNDDVFPSSVYKNATVYVKKGYIYKYQYTSGWKNFQTIKEIGSSDEIKVTNISISTPSSMTVGGTQQLTATVSPDNATNKTVKWTSGTPSVATVDETTGLVTAKSAGTATITCSATDGSNVTATCSITVNAATKPKLSLSASPSGGSVESGTKVYLTASANGSTVSGADIYYTTNNTEPTKNSKKYTSSGISITQAYTLKAIAYKDGYEDSDVGSWSYTIKSSTVEPTAITVLPISKTIKVGETFTATYSLTPSNATTTVTWDSNNSYIASVNRSTGLVTGKNAGTTYISAKTTNGKEGWCKVTVEDDGPVYVTSISLNETSLLMPINSSKPLTATVYPSNATNKSVAWSSSNEEVASVNNGKVTARKDGLAYITCKANDGSGVSASCTIYVNNGEIDEILWGTGGYMAYARTGTVTKNQKIQIAALDWEGMFIPDCTYYYTLDGSTPTKNSSHFTGNTNSTIIISKSCTLKAFATCDGYKDSKVISWQFTVEGDEDYNDGDMFTAKTSEGVEMVFTVLSSKDKTCMVGDYSQERAVSLNTTGTVTIPSSINGFKVTAIGLYAFYECTKIKSIVIPADVIEINWGAFNGCDGLEDIYCYIQEPFDLNSYMFILSDWTAYSNATLHVPYGTKEKYKSKEGWKNLKNIVEFGTSVNGISLNTSSVSLKVGETFKLYATVSSSNASNMSISWSSSNASVATVSSDGLISAKATGNATITCRVNDGSGKLATCAVTVEPEGSTGISSITMNAIDGNTPIYNLRGQRLAAPQKGINIIGGKKVIVK